MRVAVIDMGTNTFHLILVDVQFDDFKIFYRERKAVKIGKDGINEGKITDAAQLRAINALKEFATTIKEHSIDEIFATATSAIRSAANGKELLEDILTETGIKVRIISGEEEAEYIYYGVQKAIEIGQEKSLIMDIGGGSIEFIIANSAEIFWLKSFEIGGQRMLDQFHRSDPITEEEISALKVYVSTHLTELFEACELHQPTTLIGSSGTFDTLSDIYCHRTGEEIEKDKTEFPFSLDHLMDIYQEIIESDRQTRLAIPGMIEMRVELIVVAMVLLRTVKEKTGITSIRISAYALKEGVLLKTIDGLKESNKLQRKTG